jgi:hypothetical protein
MTSRPRSAKALLARRVSRLEQEFGAGDGCPWHGVNPFALATPSREAEPSCPRCGEDLIAVRLSYEPPLVHGRGRIDLALLSDEQLDELSQALRQAHATLERRRP